MVTEICKICGQEYQLGYTGTINGCDKCLGIERDLSGFAWEKDEKIMRLQDAKNKKIITVTREEAFKGGK